MEIKILLVGLLLFIAGCETADFGEITSFEECVEAGNPVMESYPRQCTANGEVFVEQLNEECEEFETYCPSLDACVTVWNTECPEYIEYYQEPQPCTMEYAPVCGEMVIPPEDEVVGVDFGNRCVAEVSGAENIRDGYCNSSTDGFSSDDVPEDLMEACEYFGGTPLEEHNECEFISEEQCDELGGEFLECESACRNHPDYPDVMCTMQCVVVCDLN